MSLVRLRVPTVHAAGSLSGGCWLTAGCAQLAAVVPAARLSAQMHLHGLRLRPTDGGRAAWYEGLPGTSLCRLRQQLRWRSTMATAHAVALRSASAPGPSWSYVCSLAGAALWLARWLAVPAVAPWLCQALARWLWHAARDRGAMWQHAARDGGAMWQHAARDGGAMWQHAACSCGSVGRLQPL
ncbi:hypothetical protein COO60DRAFT_1483011, partial [Scenedesmus sp. NREL 46B-D3]